MKSFNEFVSIKESMFTHDIFAEKENILKKVVELNVILNSMPGTFKEAATIRKESGKLEHAMRLMVKGADLDSVKKEHSDPLMLIQRINKVLQETPATVKEVMPIRQLVNELELEIYGLPVYKQYRIDMQKNISNMGQAVGSEMKQAPPPKPAPKYPWNS
jgi:hypothetical protein